MPLEEHRNREVLVLSFRYGELIQVKFLLMILDPKRSERRREKCYRKELETVKQ